MRIARTPLHQVMLIDLEPHVDERGSFARIFCTDELESAGVGFRIAQANLSVSGAQGTLRGIHVRRPPAPEAKIVRCVRGSVFDVVVDLRPESHTFLQHVTAELSAENGRAILVPERCGHAFLTTSPDSHVVYFHSERHRADTELGLRYDDPVLAIAWPQAIHAISDRDRTFPLLEIVHDDLTSMMQVG